MNLVLALLLLSESRINVAVKHFSCQDPSFPPEYGEKMTKMFFKNLMQDSLLNIQFVSSEKGSIFDILVTGEFVLREFTDIDVRYTISTSKGYLIEKKLQKAKLDEIRKSLKEALYGVLTSLWIQSFPGMAEVYMEEVKKGDTPLHIKYIPKGSYSIKIKKEGYPPRDTILNLVKPETLIVALHTHEDEEGTAWIVVSSLPYIEVYVDGALYSISTGNSMFEISPGKHEIMLKHPVYGEKNFSVNLKKGEKLYVNIFD